MNYRLHILKLYIHYYIHINIPIHAKGAVNYFNTFRKQCMYIIPTYVQWTKSFRRIVITDPSVQKMDAAEAA